MKWWKSLLWCSIRFLEKLQVAPVLSLLLLQQLPAEGTIRQQTKWFSWGEVGTRSEVNRIQLTVRLSPFTSQQEPKAASPPRPSSVAKIPESLTNPILPSQSFYIAIPPTVNVRLSVNSIHTKPVDPTLPVVLTGYAQSSDSSALSPVYKNLADAASVAECPALTVEGYEWFRGVRLARISVAPFVRSGGGVHSVEEISATIQYEESGEVRESSAKKEDPHFDQVLSKLVVNDEGIDGLPSGPLSWSDSTGSWFLVGGQYVKLAIPADGIYRMKYEDLQSLVPGINSIDPGTFQLFNRGKEIPIHVSSSSPVSFGGGDYIEFPGLRNYGLKNYRSIPKPEEEYPQYLDRYTDTSYYWLTWGGEKGTRANSNEGIHAASDTLTWYTELVHIEQDSYLQFVGGDIAVQQDPRWLAGDVWAWQFLGANGIVNVSFTANNIATDYPTVGVFARFASWAVQNVTPAHKVRLRLNNSDTLQAINLQPYEHALMEGNAPISQLVNGTNTIRVYSLPTASSVNFILFDWAEAEYPRKLIATGDSLIFGFTALNTSGVRTIRITGLSTRDVVIYKYKPSPKSISDVVFSLTPPYSVTFADSVNPGDRYMILPFSKIKQPLVRSVKTFVNLRDPLRGADYLLTTHKKFLSLAQQYAQFIGTTRKLRTAVIDVEDIFDEFGFGYPTPESIREFLKATTRWQSPMPSYVLLAGDATYDHKFVMGDKNPANRPFNSVPSLGQPVSDPWLVALDDSSILPQMYVGRIPVNTEAEFARYFQRVQSYVSGQNDDWNKRYLFFAGGDPTIPGQIESFKKVNERIISTMVEPPPIGGLSTNFYKTVQPQSDFGPYPPQVIRDALDNGGVFVCYIGHSGTQTWDNGVGEPSQLQNKRGRLALISDFGCSTAKFAEPDIKAFGELFTLGETGSAIAYVGNSALGFTSIALSLPPIFYKQFLIENIYEIGKAHLLAKIEKMQQSGGPGVLINRIMMLTNTLLGDPTIELAIPKKPNLTVKSSGLRTSPASPTDDDDNTELSIPYLNTGRVTMDTVAVLISRTYEGTRRDTTMLRPLPRFQDTLKLRFPTKDLPGDHSFSVQFNPDGRIDEIQSNDNRAELRVLVLSNAFKVISPFPGFDQAVNELVLLNPSRGTPGVSGNVALELDTVESFDHPLRLVQPLGQVVTNFSLRGLKSGLRYFWRANQEGSARPWTMGSFRVTSGNDFRWRQIDSVAWAGNTYRDTKYQPGVGVRILERLTNVRVTSSGFVDGGFGAVELNGVNVLPNTFARGHTVVVLDTLDLSMKTVRTFDLFGSRANAESLRVFLNALPLGSIVAQLVIDEGAQSLSQAAKAAIKTLGSRYIDSLGFRDSWAIIGRKGAAPGTVPELWKRTFGGRVIIDTTFIRKVQKGEVMSPEIGPAGEWLSASINGDVPTGSFLTAAVLGISKNGNVDTLIRSQTGPGFSLSGVKAKDYPKLKLLASLQPSPTGSVPVLGDWSVSIVPPPELAINYQSVTLSADTVLEGNAISISGAVYNTGYQSADSVSVVVSDLMEGKGTVPVDTIMLPSIGTGSSHPFRSTLSTIGKRGKNSIIIEIDPQNRITEFYRSNNLLSLPLYVAGDSIRPTLDLTFDGIRIFDGDYVSSRPEIYIRVFDNSPLPLTDPSSVTLTLDNRRIGLGAFPDSLFESKLGAEKATIIFRPLLPQGEHILSLQAKDATGNFADTSAFQIRFRVESLPRLLDVFNFPNPFANETRFTFNLAGVALPDELTIKVYTVAGRLIQELIVPRSQLRFGFNEIPWNGRDRDGNALANGVYFYKISMRVDGQTEEVIAKLAKVQ